MSGLEHRTKDRDGAPVDGRGVTPRAAGVSRPARGLAEIAEIAQISGTSMKWASAPGHDVPLLIAQIAEISPGPAGQPINMWRSHSGRLENAITEITEKRLESTRSHNALRVSRLPTARRLARTDVNSNPWWIDLQPNTNEPKTATEITELPKFLVDTIGCVVRSGSAVSSKGAVHLDQAGGNGGNPQIPKNLDKMGIGAVPCRLAQIGGNLPKCSLPPRGG